MHRRASRPRERERTGIASLKVGFNRVFGYYIEVTQRATVHMVPPDYQRRQTLGRRALRHAGAQGVRGEGAGREERIEKRERELFDGCATASRRDRAACRRRRALSRSSTCWASLAEVAAPRAATSRPDVDDGFELEIDGGRHPVVERMMPRDTFIPNDVALDDGRAA